LHDAVTVLAFLQVLTTPPSAYVAFELTTPRSADVPSELTTPPSAYVAFELTTPRSADVPSELTTPPSADVPSGNHS
jgi:hypothetical protein